MKRKALATDHCLETNPMTQEELCVLLKQADRRRHWSDLLDERELEAMSFLTIGLWPRQICDEMAITSRQFRKLQRSIQKKLGLRSEIAFLQFLAAQLHVPTRENSPKVACKPETCLSNP